MMRRDLELDGTRIYTEENFHQEIALLFALPKTYPHDISSLEEFMHTYVDPNFTLNWTNHHFSKKQLGHNFDRIVSTFDDFHSAHSAFEFYLN
ncbi:MAG: barstar family protein [Bacteriovoracaceae bacterium]|nr:barstar family protein [Bacteriovoracaceae bacterium]